MGLRPVGTINQSPRRDRRRETVILRPWEEGYGPEREQRRFRYLVRSSRKAMEELGHDILPRKPGHTVTPPQVYSYDRNIIGARIDHPNSMEDNGSH